MKLRIRDFKNENGAAAVEFAFISSFLMLLLAFVLEITLLVNVTRDTSRLASQLALAAATTCSDSPCVEQFAEAAATRSPNYVLLVRSLEVTTIEVTKKDGAIVILSPSGTGSPEATAAAARVLREGDIGVVLEITALPIRLLAPLLTTVMGRSESIEGRAVAIRKTALPQV